MVDGLLGYRKTASFVKPVRVSVDLMRNDELHEALTVLGIGMQTSNDVAFDTVPAHWQRFFELGGPDMVTDRIGDEIYAVYSEFEHEGLDNSGTYTFVIGALVPAGTVPSDGLQVAVVPASQRVIFDVEAGRPDLVGEQWQQIWSHHDIDKTFVAEYEKYATDGAITISIGVRPQP